ncbi:hypothetical protein FQN52_008421 [Onygenales sp. PD_12]|nr:hypothetical protein FQN52_008421 [Onygenales sp. PD_12]
MRTISCHGTPYEIGLQHGEQARKEITGSMGFYADLFKRVCGMEWADVCAVAVRFVPFVEGVFGGYMEEMRGIAQGAGVPLESILALNVRTEIAYGMFSDGCTAFSWKQDKESFLAQNWDWDRKQSPNLISLHITQASPKPSIHMITEAGIIGKIGLNSHGVGVTLNAIKFAGVAFSKIPCHLALRAALDSASRVEAIETLERHGVASACHILVADATGGTGLECSSGDIVRLNMGDAVEGGVEGLVTHTNHFVHGHVGIEPITYLEDSVPRLERARELVAAAVGKGVGPSVGVIEEVLKDEKGFPTAICREVTEKSELATLFCIVMDLTERKAVVKIGRPVEAEGVLELKP